LFLTNHLNPTRFALNGTGTPERFSLSLAPGLGTPQAYHAQIEQSGAKRSIILVFMLAASRSDSRIRAIC
jgi:hypothetical protein